MKNATLSTIASVLTTIDFENKDAILAEINKELHRGDAVKAEKAKVYADNWDAVREVLETATEGATVSEIFDSLEGKVGSDFTKGKLTYALGHQWADFVVKTTGKVNTYALKA
jgi:predicted AAA+ superfamily ATPase